MAIVKKVKKYAVGGGIAPSASKPKPMSTKEALGEVFMGRINSEQAQTAVGYKSKKKNMTDKQFFDKLKNTPFKKGGIVGKFKKK